VRSLDVSALAEGIRLVVENPEKRASIINAAGTVVRNRYSWETVLPTYRTILGQTLTQN
jgi:glycosyltransferase involved in cell wall biosynthesis